MPESHAVNAPVALLVFNRPACTQRIMERVRLARPRRLYVVADGPRAGHAGDAARCAEVRRLVTEGVTWPCDVRTNAAPENLGCGRRVSSGIDWVFSLEEAAIFIEDDCLPDVTFFRYCDELLERYRDEPRVGQICGSSFLAPRLERPASYLFSRYGPVWGWASWRRAWRHYDFAMNDWRAGPGRAALADLVCTPREARRRAEWYDAVTAGALDTWDYQWGYAKLRAGLWSAIPTTNLVENIGFDADATHHAGGSARMAAAALPFPLVHPSAVALDRDYDRAFAETVAPSVPARIRRKVRQWLHS